MGERRVGVQRPAGRHDCMVKKEKRVKIMDVAGVDESSGLDNGDADADKGMSLEASKQCYWHMDLEFGK